MDSAKEIELKRVNMLLNFLNEYPWTIRKYKHASPELNLIIHHEEGMPKIHSRNVISQSITDFRRENFSSMQIKIIEYAWRKIEERFKTTAAAFRFFDTNCKGKISTLDLAVGLENLRIKISD